MNTSSILLLSNRRNRLWVQYLFFVGRSTNTVLFLLFFLCASSINSAPKKNIQPSLPDITIVFEGEVQIIEITEQSFFVKRKEEDNKHTSAITTKYILKPIHCCNSNKKHYYTYLKKLQNSYSFTSNFSYWSGRPLSFSNAFVEIFKSHKIFVRLKRESSTESIYNWFLKNYLPNEEIFDFLSIESHTTRPPPTFLFT